MTAGCSRDAQAMGDTAVLVLVLTLLPQSLRNICHGKRAPWSSNLCSNPGWLFLCFSGGHGKLCGIHASEGVGSPPGWSSPLVQRRQMHMPVCRGMGHCWRREGTQRERRKKHSASSLVGTNSIRESKETVIKYCFSPCSHPQALRPQL